ncbi:hypothetical protein MMPV_008362 [Pyropia vietnamensis]
MAPCVDGGGDGGGGGDVGEWGEGGKGWILSPSSSSRRFVPIMGPLSVSGAASSSSSSSSRQLSNNASSGSLLSCLSMPVRLVDRGSVAGEGGGGGGGGLPGGGLALDLGLTATPAPASSVDVTPATSTEGPLRPLWSAGLAPASPRARPFIAGGGGGLIRPTPIRPTVVRPVARPVASLPAVVRSVSAVSPGRDGGFGSGNGGGGYGGQRRERRDDGGDGSPSSPAALLRGVPLSSLASLMGDGGGGELRRRGRASLGSGMGGGGGSGSFRTELLTPPTGTPVAGGGRALTGRVSSLSKFQLADSGDALGGGRGHGMGDRRHIARHQSWGPGRPAGAAMMTVVVDTSTPPRTFRPVSVLLSPEDAGSHGGGTPWHSFGGGGGGGGFLPTPERCHSPGSSASAASTVTGVSGGDETGWRAAGGGNPPVGPVPLIGRRARVAAREGAVGHRNVGKGAGGDSASSTDVLAVSAAGGEGGVADGDGGGDPLPPASAFATVATAVTTASLAAPPASPPTSSRSRRLLTRAGRSSRLRRSRHTDTPDGRSRSRSRSRSASPSFSAAGRATGGGGGGGGSGGRATPGLERRLSFSAGRSLSRLWSKTDVSGRRARSRLNSSIAATADGESESEVLASTLSGSNAAPAVGGEGGEVLAAPSLSPSPSPVVSMLPSSCGRYRRGRNSDDEGGGGKSGGGMGGGNGALFDEAVIPLSPAVPVSLSGDFGLGWPVPGGSGDHDEGAERGAGEGSSYLAVDESSASPPSPLPASSLPVVMASEEAAPATMSSPPRVWLDKNGPSSKNATSSRQKSYVASSVIATAVAVDEEGGREDSTVRGLTPATLRSSRPLSISRRHWRAATFHRTQSGAAASHDAAVVAVSAPSAGKAPPAQSDGGGSGSAPSRGSTSMSGNKTFRPWSSVSRAIGKPGPLTAAQGTAASATNGGATPPRPTRVSPSTGEGGGGGGSESGEGHDPLRVPVGRLSLPANVHLIANGGDRVVKPRGVDSGNGGGRRAGGDAAAVTVAAAEDEAWNGRGWAGNLTVSPPRGGAGAHAVAVGAPPSPSPSSDVTAGAPPSPSLAVVALGSSPGRGGSGGRHIGSGRGGPSRGGGSDGAHGDAATAGVGEDASVAAASSEASSSHRTGGRRPFLSSSGGGVASLARALLTVRRRLLHR